MSEPQKTPLYNRHIELNARMVDFHGWLMPIQYEGIVTEHIAVRSKAGIFDVSHMGEIDIKGKDAYKFIQYIVPNNLDKISSGEALYSAMCDENGGMIDDLIIYMFERNHLLIVVNASNIKKDFNWMLKYSKRFDVKVNNISSEYVLLAVQGPDSLKIVKKVLDKDYNTLDRFSFAVEDDIIVSRTGYTGEDGFEIFTSPETGIALWDRFIKTGVQPAGLGARDTLRLEKGYLLYGNDADESVTPVEAGIGWTVDNSKSDYIGKKNIVNKGSKRRLVFMEVKSGGIPRPGCNIKDKTGTKQLGRITSGTYSPTLKKGIALGYIEDKTSDINIEIRNKLVKAKIRRPL